MKLWEWLGGGGREKKETEREETRKVVWSGANGAWLQSVNGGRSFHGWTFPCLGHLLLVYLSHWGIYRSLPSITNQLYDVQRAITDPPTHSQRSKSPKLLTKWSFHKWNRNQGCTTAENLLRRYSWRFNSWNIYWLESLIDCPKKTGRVDFGTAKQVTSSLLRVGGRWVSCDPLQPVRTKQAELLESDTSARVKLQTKDTFRRTLQEFRHRMKQCGDIGHILAFNTRKGDEIWEHLK